MQELNLIGVLSTDGGGRLPVIEPKTITANGTYNVPSGVDGFNPVVVNVPSQEPNIQERVFASNGTFNPPEGVDGYAPVIIDVPMKDEITLNATTNGTYTPSEGRVYNNVIVNVPLPENAYLLKSVPNLPQAIASFNDGEEMVMSSLKVAIEPQQEGSGDPSPTNIRPISGWNKVDVRVADDVETPTLSNVYTIDLDGTRYGGKVDVVSGVLTVDRASKTVADCYWYGSNGFFYTGTVMDKIVHGDGRYDHCISDVYATKNVAQSSSLVNGEMSVDASGYIQLKDARYSSTSDFKTAMGTSQLVYELATPQTIQLTPTAVKSLLGQNNVWADTGNITDAEYFSK